MACNFLDRELVLFWFGRNFWYSDSISSFRRLRAGDTLGSLILGSFLGFKKDMLLGRGASW